MAKTANAYWTCPADGCKAVNAEAATRCEVCGLDRPPEVVPAAAAPAAPAAAPCACLGKDPGCTSCCETCVAIRRTLAKPPTYRVAAHCARCGTHSAGTNTFHPDAEDQAAPEDRGMRLCPSCWIPALRRRMELDPPSPELVARCLAQISVYTSRYPTTRLGGA